MGADHVLDPSSEDAAEALRRITGADGADLVVEASGNPRGIASTFELARFNGRIVNIGICAHDSVAAPLGLIQAKDLSIRGTTGSPGVWPQALRFIERHEIDLTPVITETYSFDEAAEALKASDDAAANIKVHMRPAS
jgi:L-iditol 2-dehydrogenase